MGTPRNRRRRGKGAELAAVAALVVGGVCRAGATAYGSGAGVATVATIGKTKFGDDQGRPVRPEEVVNPAVVLGWSSNLCRKTTDVILNRKKDARRVG